MPGRRRGHLERRGIRNEGETLQGAMMAKSSSRFVRSIMIVARAATIAAVLALAGCSHKLVSHGGDTTVPVFPDKDSFERLKGLQSQGGPAGMIGGLGASLVAKKVDDGTPVKILNSDEDGYQVEILDGASKGVTGYVSKDSVD